MLVQDVFNRVVVTSEEGGWSVVDACSEVSKLSCKVASDATSFGVGNDIDEPYSESIRLDDLPEIEKDLLPEDSARLLFLVLDELPAVILQKCVVGMTRDANSKAHADCFSEWAHRTTSSVWKPLFLEGLAVIGRFDILDCLDLREEEIINFKKNPIYIPILKLSLNKVCCQLRTEEVSSLVHFMSNNYLENRPIPKFPDGRILGQLMELYLLHWMQEQVIGLNNLSRLAEGLRHIRRDDLVSIISSPERPSWSPEQGPGLTPTPPAPTPSHQEFHSKTVHLGSLGEPCAGKWYPNSRGICVVFNQEEFKCGNPACEMNRLPRHGLRLGSSHDAVNLENTFRMFGCKTNTFSNLAKNDILTLLQQLSEAHDLECFDYIVLCFLSHGGTSLEGNHFIYSSDCQRMVLEDLAGYFGGDHCKALAGKMKIVITQACQGDRSLVVADGPSSTPSSQLSTSCQRTCVTALSDFLFCQATTPGYKAYRDPDRGSFYIRILCQILAHRGHQMEVTLCIKDVHARMLATPVYLESEKRYCTMQPQIIDRTVGQFVFQRAGPEMFAGNV